MGIDPKVVGRPMCDGKKGDVEPVAVDMDIEPVWAAKIESGQFLTRNFNGVLSRYVHVSPRTRSSAFDLCSAWGHGAEVVRHPWHPECDGRGPGVASETVHGPGFMVINERDMIPMPIIAAEFQRMSDEYAAVLIGQAAYRTKVVHESMPRRGATGSPAGAVAIGEPTVLDSARLATGRALEDLGAEVGVYRRGWEDPEADNSLRHRVVAELERRASRDRNRHVAPRPGQTWRMRGAKDHDNAPNVITLVDWDEALGTRGAWVIRDGDRATSIDAHIDFSMRELVSGPTEPETSQETLVRLVEAEAARPPSGVSVDAFRYDLMAFLEWGPGCCNSDATATTIECLVSHAEKCRAGQRKVMPMPRVKYGRACP